MRIKRILFTQSYSYFLHFLALFSFTWQPRSRNRLVCLKHEKVGYLGCNHWQGALDWHFKFQSNAVYLFILYSVSLPIDPCYCTLHFPFVHLSPICAVCSSITDSIKYFFLPLLPQNRCLQVFTFIIIFTTLIDEKPSIFALSSQMNPCLKLLYMLYYTLGWPFGISFENKGRRGKKCMILEKYAYGKLSYCIMDCFFQTQVTFFIIF